MLPRHVEAQTPMWLGQYERGPAENFLIQKKVLAYFSFGRENVGKTKSAKQNFGRTITVHLKHARQQKFLLVFVIGLFLFSLR